jgi:hypothetical protein
MSREGQIEKVLWNIAFPGFGQILNGKFLRGTPLDTIRGFNQRSIRY